MNAKDLAKLFPDQASKILGDKPAKKQLTELEKIQARMAREALENTFFTTWQLWTGKQRNLVELYPEPQRQFQFDAKRKYKFDFAWPEIKLAVEVHGGQWSGGRHGRGKGLSADCQKKRLAIEQGWYVLEYLTEDIQPKQIVKTIEQVIKIYEQRKHASP